MDNDKKKLLAGGLLGGVLLGANAGKIIKGIGVGLVSIVAAFAMVFFSVNGVVENSKSVDALELQSVEDAKGSRELVKVFGEISTESALSLKLVECTNTFCVNPKVLLEKGNLIYTDVKLQRFEVIRKIEEEEKSGSRTTETVSYKHEWVTKSDKREWADLSFGGLDLDPEDANIRVDKSSEELAGVYIEGLTNLETYGRAPESDEPVFGTTRALVSYITQDDREYIVVGEMRSSGITSGNPYIVTDESDTELVATLGGEESTTRTVVRFLAFALLTFGFTSMLSPILVFTDMIPIAGSAARGAATLVSGILAAIIIAATILLLNFWWVIGVVLVVLVIGFGLMTLRGADAAGSSGMPAPTPKS